MKKNLLIRLAEITEQKLDLDREQASIINLLQAEEVVSTPSKPPALSKEELARRRNARDARLAKRHTHETVHSNHALRSGGGSLQESYSETRKR